MMRSSSLLAGLTASGYGERALLVTTTRLPSGTLVKSTITS
jgi:hypothetical protein